MEMELLRPRQALSMLLSVDEGVFLVDELFRGGVDPEVLERAE